MSELSKVKVGDCTVTPSLNRVERDGRSIKIAPRTMDALIYLTEHAGEVVSTEEFINELWPGRVGDDQVYKRINQLRQALGDQREHPRFIQTVPKRGYRLIASVTPIKANARVSAAQLLNRPAIRVLGVASIAVLLLALVLAIGQYRQKQQSLTGETAAELVAESPANPVGEATQQQLTGSAEAYDYYLRAGATDLTAGLPTSLRHQYLDQAIALDPTFAHAHARKANAYTLSLVDNVASGATDFRNLAERARLGREHAEKALALDPTVGEAHMTLARLHQYHWRWDEARQAYERALKLSPGAPDLLRLYSQLISEMGDNAKAIKMARRAVDLSPQEAGLRFRLGTVLLHAKDQDAAVAAFRKTIELEPRYIIAHIYLGIVESVRGNDKEAASELRVAEQFLPNNTMPHLIALIAYGYSRLEHHEDRDRVVARIQESIAGHPFGAGTRAFISLALGDDRNALDWILSAIDRVQNQQPDVSYYNLMVIRANAFSDPVLEEPRFQEARGRLGPLIPAI